MRLTQSALASLLGMNQSKISELMSGKSEPTLKQAKVISQRLNISPAIVLGVWIWLSDQLPDDREIRCNLVKKFHYLGILPIFVPGTIC